MKQLLTDKIKYKMCYFCYSEFIYDEEVDTYNVFDKFGKPTLMISCPKCNQSIKEEYSHRLKFMIEA